MASLFLYYFLAETLSHVYATSQHLEQTNDLRKMAKIDKSRRDRMTQFIRKSRRKDSPNDQPTNQPTTQTTHRPTNLSTLCRFRWQVNLFNRTLIGRHTEYEKTLLSHIFIPLCRYYFSFTKLFLFRHVSLHNVDVWPF